MFKLNSPPTHSNSRNHSQVFGMIKGTVIKRETCLTKTISKDKMNSELLGLRDGKDMLCWKNCSMMMK